jgi:hypothetical protein
MRELSAFGSDASFELCAMMRWQRRAGEVCFVLAIPSFAYSAGSMIFLKTVGTTFEKMGLYCGCVLALASISIIVILLTMERLKKAAHKKLKLSTLTAKQTFAGHFLAHKKLNAKHEDAPAGSTQLGLHVRKDRNAGSNGPLAGSEQAKALGANPRSELPEPEVRLATLKTMLDKDLITKVEFEAQGDLSAKGNVKAGTPNQAPLAFYRNTCNRLPLVAWFGGWKGAAANEGLDWPIP